VVLVMPPIDLSPLLRDAVQHHQSGRLPQAEALYREVLAREPQHPQALHYLGLIAHQVGRHGVAVQLMTQAAAFAPGDAALRSNLGEAYRLSGRFAEAIASFKAALALQPEFPDALNNLGAALVALGRLDEAAAYFGRAITLQPNSVRAHYNLGIALHRLRRMDEARAAFERAIALKPDFAEAHNNLGNLFRDQNRVAEAVACYRLAYTHGPHLAEVHLNIATFHRERGLLDEALGFYQQALSLRPDLIEGQNNLGNIFKDRGQLDEALACYRKALNQDPRRADIHSNLVLGLLYYSDDEAGTIAPERALWNRRHAPPLAQYIHPHPNDPAPDRRLRVGYVSPDFYDHAVALNLLPLFERHDRAQVEVFCYARVRVPDAVTANVRAHADHWLDTNTLTDEEVTARVRADRIDILVDLALHTGHNRLLVFARKPAPVQVSFGGYPGGTGLETIDYHLTDPHLEPPAASPETGPDAPYRLPATFWCYDPGVTDLPVNPLPALTSGYVTFGCLGNFCKINDAVLRLWAQVIGQVAGSKLLLLAPEGNSRERALACLAAHGVGPDRIVFVGRQLRRQYLEYYQRIDLCLDTFPYNGHTTSLDACWMGVPVVTLVGKTVVGRAGWSQLSNLGLTELAAPTPEEFVAIAAGLARDLPRLARLRASLRERMERSPLMDARAFTDGIEAAYRTLWRRWCEKMRSAPT
jgi:protein O-GlcNAc transferase